MSAARSHLAAIASAPRPAGGSAERAAREYCAGVLRAAGFDVAEHSFEYSAFPGRRGTPLAGVVVAAMFAAAGCAGFRGNARASLVILVFGAMLLGGLAFWLARWGVLDVPLARARGVNLAATRGSPTLWLVAHLDSKSQPVPIGVRAAGIIACIAMWAAAMLIAIAQVMDAAPEWIWLPITVLGVLASAPVIASIVGAHSPGALDDASGVAAVLRVAELLPRDASLAVLLTSAEELGLAGARAWSRERPRARAVNIDGVDDAGAIRLIFTQRAPRSLVAVLGRGGEVWPRPRRLPPGALMDGVALADAGWEVLNISKGSWRTVSRIHSLRDDLAHLEGSGVEEVAGKLARAIIAEAKTAF
ncbi:MAG TPA: M28 family peptidase [Gemmatimonadaceae bacterium]